MVQYKLPVTPWCNNLSLAGKRPERIKSPLTRIQYLREVPGFRSRVTYIFIYVYIFMYMFIWYVHISYIHSGLIVRDAISPHCMLVHVATQSQALLLLKHVKRQERKVEHCESTQQGVENDEQREA